MRPPAAVGVLAVLLVIACDDASPFDPSPDPATVAAAPTDAPIALVAGPERPFKGRFEGAQTVVVTPPVASVQVSAAGVGTGLGRFTIELPHTVNLPTSTAQGTATLVTADGAVLTATFTGQAQLGPVVHIVELATVTGGTGRFAGATGSFTIERTYDPGAGRTVGSFDGTISVPPPVPD